MKLLTITILGLFFSINLFAQKENIKTNNREVWYEPQPKGMSFIGQGNYKRTIIVKNDTVFLNESVAPFWMSNEITNKEFREFTTSLLLEPNDSLCWIDYNKAISENAGKAEIKSKKYDVCTRYSDASKNIIDTSVFKNDDIKYHNYFTNKEFDDFPVVGVSNKGAMLYCIWKTKTEVEKIKQEGKNPTLNDYRLPVEEEWYYAASMPMLKSKTNDRILQKSLSGIKRKNGLLHFSDNVSEWTSTNSNMKLNNSNVVLGGSWKDNLDFNNRFILDKDSKTNNIGFRIVRSYRSN